MAVFEWNPFNGSGAKISRYIQGFKCRTTNIVAYYIPNKHNINIDFSYDGDYQPLENNYGIYFLIGDPSESGGKPTIYIGQATTREGTKGMDRLKEHINLSTDWYKEKWESAIYVTSTDNSWSTSLIDTLEHLFIACFRNREEYTCLNSKKGKEGNIPDKDFKTELLAIAELLALPMFGYMVSKDMKSDVINSVYDKLLEMANDIKAELKEELKAEYLTQYTPEDRKRIEWVKKVEAYDSLKTSIELANNYVLFGRIINGHKGDVLTPEHIAKDMVDLIPATEFHSKARFFDIACKSGIYLKCLLDRLMSDDTDLPINHEEEYADKHKRLKHIVENQLYGICLSRNGYMVSNRRFIEAVENYADEIDKGRFTKSILNSITVLPNIIYLSGYESMVKTDPKGLIAVLKNRFGIEDGDTLKFDVVIGNPPYNRGMDLDFVALGYILSSQYTVMITPAKWQTAEADQKIASRISYGNFRKYAVPYMSHICYYVDTTDIFDIQLPTGITYFLMDKSIHEKVQITNKFGKQLEIFNDTEYRDIGFTLCNFGQHILDLVKDMPRFCQMPLSQDKQYICKVCTLLSNKRIWDSKGMTVYNCQTQVCAKEYLGEYYQIASFDTQTEAESCKSWIELKLNRFIMLLGDATGISINSYKWVPAPPSGKFDHIYTDQELYQAFNLPQKYIDIIEAVIKERK